MGVAPTKRSCNLLLPFDSSKPSQTPPICGFGYIDGVCQIFVERGWKKFVPWMERLEGEKGISSARCRALRLRIISSAERGRTLASTFRARVAKADAATYGCDEICRRHLIVMKK